jgi:hypothetical protein
MSEDWTEKCGTGFSLWGLVLAATKPHRLKPALLKAQNLDFRKRYGCGGENVTAAAFLHEYDGA